MGLVVLAVWGVVVQAIGVYYDDRSWDALPQPIDRSSWRVWEWDDPQILRALHSGWHGTQLGPLLWQAFTDPQPAQLRRLDAADLAGDLALEGAAPASYSAGGRTVLRLRVTNRSTVTWPAFSDFGHLDVGLVYSWWRNGSMLNNEGGFIALPRNLPSGASDELWVHIDAPAARGRYELQIALVQVLEADAGTSGGVILRLPAAVD
jgi:hypothetical protein